MKKWIKTGLKILGWSVMGVTFLLGTLFAFGIFEARYHVLERQVKSKRTAQPPVAYQGQSLLEANLPRFPELDKARLLLPSQAMEAVWKAGSVQSLFNRTRRDEVVQKVALAVDEQAGCFWQVLLSAPACACPKIGERYYNTVSAAVHPYTGRILQTDFWTAYPESLYQTVNAKTI